MNVSVNMNASNNFYPSFYYFYNDLINLKDFDPKLLKLNKKSSMDIGIYYIGYVTKKPEYNINSVNLFPYC